MVAQNTEVEKLLERGPGERFEDWVQRTYDKGVRAKEWARMHPTQTAVGTGTVVAVWLGLQFGLPWAINKYHETRAGNDIESAETHLATLTETQGAALRDLDNNRFIVIDTKEPALDDRITEAGRQAGVFFEDLDEAHEMFEDGNFKGVRAWLETDYDEEHQGPGLIDTIEATISPVAYVSDYTLDLRDKRDTALSQEGKLDRETNFEDHGFSDPYLQNPLGGRLRGVEPILAFCLEIAIRQGVITTAYDHYNLAEDSFSSAAGFFDDAEFLHYTEEFDGTMDTSDYKVVLADQQTVFNRISNGDGSIERLVAYRTTLTMQWFTVVTNRERGSHEESYEVTINNPSFRSWTEQDCETVTKYCSRTRTRSRANADGSVDYQTVTVREACGTEQDCRTVHKDNGQPRRIQETRWRTIQEYWVTTDTHKVGGTTSSKVDLKSASAYGATKNQNGYQVWKPYGDDRNYQGKGGIGPNGERPHIVQ
jgi:hypothetical protein